MLRGNRPRNNRVRQEHGYAVSTDKNKISLTFFVNEHHITFGDIHNAVTKELPDARPMDIRVTTSFGKVVLTWEKF